MSSFFFGLQQRLFWKNLSLIHLYYLLFLFLPEQKTHWNKGNISWVFQISYHGLNNVENTLKRVLCKKHEVEKHCKGPHIYQNSIRLIWHDLRCHVFLSSAVSLGSYLTNGSCKAKISNFVNIGDVVSLLF